MTIERELADLNQKMMVAEANRDRLFFEVLLSKTLVFRRVTGKVVGKGVFLGGFDKPYPYRDPIATDIEVMEVDGCPERVLVMLKIFGIGTTEQGNIKHCFRNIRVFSKADNEHKWQVEFWYNYELTSL